MSGGVTRFSVSVDPELLEEFDDVIGRTGYSRSSAIQVAMRVFPEADPVKKVNGRWGVYSPIYVIATKKAAQEAMPQLLASIPKVFRSTVVDTMNRYEAFSQAIGAPGILEGMDNTDRATELEIMGEEAFAKAARKSARSRAGLTGLRGIGGLRGL